MALAKVFKSETQKLPLKKLYLSANIINKIASIKVLASALHRWLPRRLEEIDLRENLLLRTNVTQLNGREEGTCDTVLSLLKPLVKNVIADRSTVDGYDILPDFADYVAEM